MGNEQSKDKVLTMKGNSPEKHENGTVNGLSANITSNGLEIDVNGETTVQQNGGPLSLNLAIESTEPNCVTVESDCNHADDPIISEIPETTVQEVVEEVKKSKEGKVKVFGKMFKKKTEPPADVKSVNKTETSNEDQTDVSLPATDPQPETANLKQESESLTASESVTLDPGPEEGKAPETDSQPVENQEDSNPEENPVMNFFKTLVTPTKTTKKETATPDATKDQSQKENQPAATTTVAQVSEPPAAPKGMSIPPPPPPEPPKMEIKGEPAAKPVKPTPKEEPKAAAKEPESSKGKSAKNTLSKFFRPKTIKEAPQSAVEMVEELPQPVVEAEKVDPSKASTLEASAKPEPPPPVQEEKKTASKSPFLSFFKPKVLLDHMTTKVQAASTSGVRLLRRTTWLAADPKKATPAPAAAAEAAQTVKAKEEPKVAAKSSEAAVDNKPASAASQAGDDAASVPRKLEKRNSIHLFFKNLGQKRNSTDAGVQTEPVTVAPAAEKAK
ncbi:breast carcinoma-amplified sequence 1 isoform X22 [Siniperca chuatsi]|uniref:breast carcinoma-amplified sequence 1 isoform X22 n=1 Tax=Siniperca chuatsi TaxID=119488 RepID=UPI001CE04466|nr:breast carcinoma-amplified sequence 1 isoform X22 [Siniperca chuatsi]